MKDIQQVVYIMSLIGIPSIFAVSVSCIRIVHRYTRQIKILMKSQQAQMRSKLLDKYHKHMSEGWISEEALEDWENQYQSYHELGQNGILDARRQNLFSLPNRPNN